jgi:acetyl esterase/lipase
MKLLPILFLLAVPLFSAEPKVIPLYDGPAPGSESWNWPETSAVGPNDTILRIGNVTRPALTVFLPDPAKATGTGIVICPGGGFRILAFNHEGTEVAEYLNSLGVAAFVLKYRVARTGDEGEKEQGAARRKEAQAMGIADGRRAVALVRAHAAEWGVKPNRIGILGFSAGGWVASGVALEHDAQSRPDFAAPIYGALPPEFKVPSDAMPLFLVHADDDKTVPPARTSVKLYTAWKEAGFPAEMHIYSAGGHGFGMRKKNLPVDGWTDRLREWLGVQGLLAPAQ